jgi:hypothetical protein
VGFERSKCVWRKLILNTINPNNLYFFYVLQHHIGQLISCQLAHVLPNYKFKPIQCSLHLFSHVQRSASFFRLQFSCRLCWCKSTSLMSMPTLRMSRMSCRNLVNFKNLLSVFPYFQCCNWFNILPIVKTLGYYAPLFDTRHYQIVCTLFISHLGQNRCHVTRLIKKYSNYMCQCVGREI